MQADQQTAQDAAAFDAADGPSERRPQDALSHRRHPLAQPSTGERAPAPPATDYSHHRVDDEQAAPPLDAAGEAVISIRLHARAGQLHQVIDIAGQRSVIQPDPILQADLDGLRDDANYALPPGNRRQSLGMEGAEQHAAELRHFIDRSLGFGADVLRCADMEAIRARMGQHPVPEVLYAYVRAGDDLDALADALGDAVPLVLLNLIGEQVPLPPDALVRRRKLICVNHAVGEADQARAAGFQWLKGVFDRDDAPASSRISGRSSASSSAAPRIAM